jgi:N-acetylglutamate synthase-like GNAT family acetyltransferase
MELSPAQKVSDELLRECAEMLHSYWGGGIENRKASLIAQQNCFLLLNHTRKGETAETITRVLGHVKMNTISKNSDLHFGNSKCGIITSVIINSKYRRDGSGYGRHLMTLLEERARADGYCYLYLWTNDAMGFYLKLGYQATERVIEFTSVFRSLENSVISKFESMLSLKLQQSIEGIPPSSPASPSSSAGDSQLPYIYYKKRLLDEHPLQTIPSSQWKESLQHTISHQLQHSSLSSFGSCFVNLLSWSPQIGPSCGLQALRFSLDYFASHFNFSSSHSLLQRAISSGYSNDGEIFNIFHLLALINLLLNQSPSLPSATSVSLPPLILPSLHISVVPFSSLSWTDITEILTSTSHGGLVILPYDRNPIDHTPCEENGRKAHYGVICGYLEHRQTPSRSEPERNHVVAFEEKGDLRSLSLKWGQEDSSALPVEQSLLMIQGMSSKPILASHTSFLSSNQQLFQHRECHEPLVSNKEYIVPEGGPILADLCLVFRPI